MRRSPAPTQPSSAASIPMYRLAHFQIERMMQGAAELPPVLQKGKVLSAVYRVGPYKSATGTPQGYALRLLVDPAAHVAGAPASRTARMGAR